MAIEQHIDKLRADHASLEIVINEELNRPLPDTNLIASLKKRKLRIKDEINRLIDNVAA